NERVALARGLLGLGEPVLVAFAVAELQRIFRGNPGAELLGVARIEETLQPLAAADAHVMAALRAHIQVALELSTVEHRIAGGALDPQPLRDRAGTPFGLDSRGHDLFEPGH